MSFGKNPHVAKAQAAEQKALDAGDQAAREMAYREAAHQWDRAASREPPGKRRTEYEQLAEQNRLRADGGGNDGAEGDDSGSDESATQATPPESKQAKLASVKRLLN
jgi:hypothetical protein